MRENEANISRRQLSREERKALRMSDLQECTAERRAELKADAQSAIDHFNQSRTEFISDIQHSRNLAPHLLTLECLADID